MKRTWWLTAAVLGTVASLWLAAPTSYAGTYDNPTQPGVPGYIDDQTRSIQGGNEFRIDSDGSDPAPSGKYKFVIEDLVITAPDGQQLRGYVEGFDLEGTNIDNGYNLVLDNDLASYVSALGGNLSFVQANTNTATLKNLTHPNGITYTVRNFADVVDESGATFTGIDYNNVEGDLFVTYKVQASAPPDGSVYVERPTYTVGDTVAI
ncbi:MAG: hypothetical protein K6T83_20760, partial [Alicyclobacillus sp.]|nr:hypothetical protein [Alicyclobacillus sp.]